ncbi:hypothetical protein Tco_0389173, partial [Tanacetum coccineum]
VVVEVVVVVVVVVAAEDSFPGMLSSSHHSCLLIEPEDTLLALLPNLLNTSHSLSLDFHLGDLDRSRLILENTLGLGLGLWERLDLCLFSCSLVLIVLDWE